MIINPNSTKTHSSSAQKTPFHRVLGLFTGFLALESSLVSAKTLQSNTYYPVASDGSGARDILDTMSCQLSPSLNCPPADQSFPLPYLERDLWQEIRQIPEPKPGKICGNKAKHLNEKLYLKTLLNVPHWDIPEPHCVDEVSVETFLRNKAPRVFKLWEQIATKNPDKVSFAQDEEIKGLLQEIREEIVRAFSLEEAPKLLEIEQTMGSWLEKKRSQGRFLMVRSSGAEDSHATANAGGNLSESYVEPEAQSVCLATGQVVASYFEEKSLQNRLNAGLHPFKEEFHIGVLVQELIGEEVGGASDPSHIPISFVMFTNEPSYVQGESFRTLQISASYGHGEGVVESVGISSDTILVTVPESSPDQIHYLYDLQEKKRRLAPLKEEGKITLKPVENPSHLIHKRLFNQEQVATLYQLAVLIESFYDFPTDIEGVFLDGVFYFVQSRPIIRQNLLPTYLDAESAQSLKVYPITLGKGGVLQIKDRSQIREAPTLQEANMGFIESEHKAALVKEPESSQNSHSVVNFKGMGAPSFYTPSDPDSFLSQMGGDQFLVVDTQRGMFYLWDQSQPLSDHIKRGFVEHPAVFSHSLLEEKLPILALSEPSSLPIQNLLTSLSKARSRKEYVTALDEFKKMPELVSLSLHIQELEKYEKKIPSILPYLKTLKNLESEVLHFLEEAYASLPNSEESAYFTSMKNLFILKAIKTFSLGSENSSGIASYSLKDVRSLIDSAQALISYQTKLFHPSYCSDLLIFGTQSSQEAFTHWEHFLLDVENLAHQKKISPQEIERFKGLIHLLDETKTLSFWLTFLQGPGDQDPLNRFHALLRSVPASEEKEIHSFREKQRSIENLQKKLTHFADPETFAESLRELEKHIEELIAPSWVQKIKTLSPVSQSIAIQMMKATVDVIDLAAKEVKSASDVPAEIRAKHFKEILSPYFKLMNAWANGLIPDELANWNNNSPYFSRIQDILSTRPETSDQLRPSPDFSVAAAMIGSRAAFERHLPNTLEDLLTLMHQNSLESLSTYYKKAVIGDTQHSLLPKKLLETLTQIEAFYKKSDYQIQQMSIEINGKYIVIKYNIPLRNHSSGLEIKFDLSSEEIILKTLFLGQARSRWNTIHNWFSSLNHLIYEEQHLHHTEQELIASWSVATEQIETICKELIAAAVMTNTEVSEEIFIESRYLEWKQQGKNIFLLEQLQNSRSSSFPYIFQSCMQDESLSFEFKQHILSRLESQSESYNNQKEKGTYLKILNLLVQQGYGMAEATQVALQGVSDQDLDVRRESFEILKLLVEKGYGIPEAIQAASKGISDQDWLIRNDSLGLLKLLVEKGYGTLEITQAALKGLSDQNWIIRDDSFGLLKLIVEKGHGTLEITQAALKGLLDSVFFERLVEKGSLVGLNEVIAFFMFYLLCVKAKKSFDEIMEPPHLEGLYISS